MDLSKQLDLCVDVLDQVGDEDLRNLLQAAAAGEAQATPEEVLAIQDLFQALLTAKVRGDSARKHLEALAQRHSDESNERSQCTLDRQHQAQWVSELHGARIHGERTRFPPRR